MISVAHRLGWSLVDPASRPFDPAAAREIAERIVRPLTRNGALPTQRAVENPQQTRCERDLDLALVAHYGAWVAGWNWSTREPGGGGPVRGWCCARDSVLPRGESADATIDRVVAAVCEWRAFLVELAQMQSALLNETAALPREDAVERAAARYVPFVVERTGASDAWYSTFVAVLAWHLEAVGDGGDRVARVIRAVVSGRFASWCAPPASVAAEVCADLGRRVAETLAGPAAPDALADWIVVRRRATWERARRHQPGAVTRDGHRMFIARHDRPRDAERARRMDDALTFLRGAVDRPLTWELLRDAQARVLGDADVAFRATDAFAKGGSERYGSAEATAARFARCLAETEDPSVTPVARAARVYLDVCFFHPFPDGNARAARLALDHVLTRAGLALHSAEPVFLLPRRASDPEGPWSLTYLLDQLAGSAG